MSNDSKENDEWIDIYDFLGTDDPDWSVKAVKELLCSLIENKAIYEWDEATLYSFLLKKGLLNLDGNRHFDFLNNLAKTCKTKAGLKAIEDYATSESEIPPNTSHYTSDQTQLDGDTESTEIETTASKDKAYRSFEEARDFVKSLGLKSTKEWEQYCKSGNKPDDIPTNPWNTYKEWKKK